MISMELRRDILRSRKVVTVDYSLFAPVLETGYYSSLDLANRETMHFAVIKTQYELQAASEYLHPFIVNWRVNHPGRKPTMVILAVNSCISGFVHSSADTAVEPAQILCRRVLRNMSLSARKAGLESFGMLYPPEHLADLGCGSDMYAALSLPRTYVPCGVFGISESRSDV